MSVIRHSIRTVIRWTSGSRAPADTFRALAATPAILWDGCRMKTKSNPSNSFHVYGSALCTRVSEEASIRGTFFTEWVSTALAVCSGLGVMSFYNVGECESQSNTGGTGGEDDIDPSKDPHTAIMRVWDSMEQEILRNDATMPNGIMCAPVHAPTITNSSDNVMIDLNVRYGVSLKSLERRLMNLQPSMMGHFSYQSSQVREDMSKRLVQISQGNRTITLTLPKTPHDMPTITFVKRGRLDDGDMPILAHLMSLANNLQLEQQSQKPFPFTDNSSGDIHDMLSTPFEMFGPLSEMQQVLEQLEAQFKNAHSIDDSDGEPFPGFESGMRKGGARPQLDSNQTSTNSVEGGLSWDAAVKQLQQLGALVYLPEDEQQKQLDWSDMAGYEEQKRMVEDLVLMTVRHSDEFERVAKKTRKDGKHQRPKAVLLEGPPGTGKTTCARIVSSQAAIPLIYIPLESVASKWYGESEQKLSSMLNIAERMGGCIIFLDEVDSLATSRADDMNEATRRLLGVLLRFIDGFKATDSIVIGATNRKQDLDTALLSRCQSIVSFGLPDLHCRAEILKHYAAHLGTKDLHRIAEITDGMSARDLRAICEVAERKWVSSIIRGSAPKESLPPLSEYLNAARARVRFLSGP